MDFPHLSELAGRLVQWVTRAKDNMKYRVVKILTKGHGNIVRDQLVQLTGKQRGMRIRRVEAWAGCEIDYGFRSNCLSFFAAVPNGPSW